MAKQTLNNGETGLVHRTKLNENFTELYDDKVPYTGATQDVDLDTYKLNAQSIHAKGTGGAGHLGLKHQSADITASTSESSLGANSAGNPVWKNDGNAIQKIMLENASITGATKTKITYDTKGLITAGADATQDDIGDGTTYKQYSATEKTKLTGIEAGAEVNNISDANALELTDGGATTLHKHSYNDLDDKPTIPTQYTDEMAQDAVGGILTDSTEIDFTYDDATPSITASIIAGSIDETKLDTSINASLDLADSAVQPTNTVTLTNKDLTDSSNIFPTLNQDTTGKSAKTDALQSATTTVNVSSATAPTAGQVLTATDDTHATWQDPSGGGTDTNLWNLRIMAHICSINTTTWSNVGFHTSPTSSGSSAGVNPLNTNYVTRNRRVQYTSTAAINSLAGMNTPTSIGWLGDGTNGGFDVTLQWTKSSTYQSTEYAIHGLKNGGLSASVLPASQSNCIFIGHDPGETEYSYYTRAGGTMNKVSFGADFPCNTNLSDWYIARIWSLATEDVTVYFRLYRITTANVVYDSGIKTVSDASLLPLSSTSLICYNVMGTGAGTTARVIHCGDLKNKYDNTLFPF